MALTHTLAGLRTALDTYNTAVAAALGTAAASSAWSTAWAAFVAYETTWGGLPTGVQTEGFAAGMPRPADLRATLEKASSQAVRDRRRMIRTQVRK